MESQHMKFLHQTEVRFKRPWNRPFLASEANDNFGTKLSKSGDPQTLIGGRT